MTSWRTSLSEAKRDELALAYARDGYALLEAVYDGSSPAWLREIPSVEVLRRVLLQNYTRTVTGNGREVIRRREKEPEGDGLPPGHADRLPVRHRRPVGRQRDASGWAASCTSPRPATMPRPATAAARRRAGGAAMTRTAAGDVPEPDHERGHHRRHGARHSDDGRHPRRARGQGPGAGTALPRPGYLSAAVVVAAQDQARHRPDRPAAGGHLRAGPRRARLRPRRLRRRLRQPDRHLPAGQDRRDLDAVHPERPGRHRGHLRHQRLRPLPGPRPVHGQRQETTPAHRAAPRPGRGPGRRAPRRRPSRFEADYARRACVEGTMHQAAAHGARRARYRGLPKTRLDHAYMAGALNLLRLEASGPAPRSTGTEPATWHASNSTSPHDRINHQDRHRGSSPGW